MDRSIVNNRLINDIMSNSSPVTIVLSSSDGESIDFVSDLSNCYKNTFWINSDHDNMYSFTITLAQKVFGNDEVMMRKLMQFKYCELDYDKDNIILNVALQKISSMAQECLLVLDNLENLPVAFNNKLIELLIKNCPKNLRILLISETFLDLNYNLFEPNCPKLIDETVISKNKTNDFSDLEKLWLSDSDLAFLCYISQITNFDRKFVYDIYKRGNEILSMLSIKYKNIVFCKGSDLYWINPQLHDYLLESHPEYESYDFFMEDINKRLYKHYLETGKHVKAIKLAFLSNWYDMADKAIQILMNDEICSFMLEDFAMNINTTIIRSFDVKQYYYGTFLRSLVEYCSGCFDISLNLLDSLLQKTKEGSNELYKLYCIKCRCLAEQGKNKEAAELCYDVIKSALVDDAFEEGEPMQCLLGYLPALFRNSNKVLEVSVIKKHEQALIKESNANCYWYPKIVQAAADAYFDLGYYTKAIGKVEMLKNIFPFYMLPHKLIDYYYYSGQIEKYVSSAKMCLENSKLYNIDSDLASVYTLLAKGSAYYQRYEEALNYMDLAVKCENSSDQVKYYAIATRGLMYARMGKLEYAKDIAIIYTKICELNNSKYTYFFYAVLAFCYWNQKNLDQTKFYANKCLLSASAKSGTWFLASSLSISCIILKGEIREPKSLLTKFINTCKVFGMESYIVDYYCCFETPIQRAREEGVMLDYLDIIQAKIEQKKTAITTESKIYIKYFGNTSVIVNNEQVVWKTKKTKELFLLYVQAGDKGIDRKRIIDLLWKDYVYVSSLNNLKTTNNIIRNTLQTYNVPFKMEYVNSKYTLYLPSCETDYDSFHAIIKVYRDDMPLMDRAELLRKAFILYDNGFAPEIDNEEFDEVRKSIQSEMLVKSLKLIEDLIAKGEYLEAKRFLNNFDKMNAKEEDYIKLQNEIDNNIHKRF